MQEIKAYIKYRKLDDVTLALHGVGGVSGMSVVEVCGFGRSKSHTSVTKPTDGAADVVRHARVEPTAAGRVYAADGGVYVSVALGWLCLVEGVRSQTSDLIGVAVVLFGMSIIMFAPRGT